MGNFIMITEFKYGQKYQKNFMHTHSVHPHPQIKMCFSITTKNSVSEILTNLFVCSLRHQNTSRENINGKNPMQWFSSFTEWNNFGFSPSFCVVIKPFYIFFIFYCIMERFFSIKNKSNDLFT